MIDTFDIFILSFLILVSVGILKVISVITNVAKEVLGIKVTRPRWKQYLVDVKNRKDNGQT